METRPILRTAWYAKGADYTALKFEAWEFHILFLVCPRPFPSSASLVLVLPSYLSFITGSHPFLHLPRHLLHAFALYHITRIPNLHNQISIIHFTLSHFILTDFIVFFRISGSIYFIHLTAAALHEDVRMLGR